MVAARQGEKGWNGRKEKVYSLPIKGNPRGGVSYMETNDAKKKSTMHPLHIVSENHKRFLHHIKENLRDMEKKIKSWEYVSNRAKRQNAHCKNQLHRYIITTMMNDGVIFLAVFTTGRWDKKRIEPFKKYAPCSMWQEDEGNCAVMERGENRREAPRWRWRKSKSEKERRISHE